MLKLHVTNIGITLTNINVDPNDGVKTKFVLDILSLCETNKKKLCLSTAFFCCETKSKIYNPFKNAYLQTVKVKISYLRQRKAFFMNKRQI
jgi:hypothetical protein